MINFPTEKIRSNTTASRITTNFGWSLVSEATSKGVFFVTSIYLARVLGVKNFGIFTLAQTITFYFWFAVDLGTTMYGIREIAKNKENAEEIINPLFTMRIASGFVVFALYLAALLFLQNIPSDNKLCYIGCGLYLLTYSLYTDWVFKGFEKFKFIAIGSLASSMTFLIVTFSFAKNKYAMVITSFAWSISYLIASISLLLFLYYGMRFKLKLSFNINVWYKHIKESIYFTNSGILMLLYQYVPILLLTVFFTKYEVGIFSAPYRVVITICSAGFLIPLAFYPVFAELYSKDKAEFYKFHKYIQNIMLILGTPIAIIGTIWSAQIVGLLFGSQYEQSAIIFKILIWLIPLYLLRSSYGSVLMAAGHQREHNIATLTGAISASVLGLLLIPQLKVKGGAISLLLAEVSMIGIFMSISKRTIFAKKIKETL